MKDSLKDKIVLSARRLMRKAPFLRGLIMACLVVVLFLYHVFYALASNTKKLVLLALLLVFYTISCSFGVPMFHLEEERVQEIDTQHLEGVDIALAAEEQEGKEEGQEAGWEDTEDTISENPEAEEDGDIDNYSSDEILALHEAGGIGAAADAESMDAAAEPEAALGTEAEAASETGLETEAALGTEAESGSVSADDWSLLLVNNRHPIPEDYEFTLGTIVGGLQCDERIIPELLEMLQGAKQDGISLEICSPYRTDERQVMLFERKIKRYMKKGMSYMDAYKISAQTVNVPGTSEHQIGLALDIYTGSYRTLDEGFGETREGIWLREHCSEYGFILRYPKGKEYITGIEYEPWHFRYVGKATAKEIMEQGITLEEFIDML